jgi:molecular chaperone HscA
MVEATLSALKADGDLLGAQERADMEALMATLRQTAAASTDAAEVEAATQALGKGTESFAAMRMNRGISRALAGRHIETM